ncbi:MAG: hypothetical protein OFPI_11960 [Osedax symbiont Rs2]|nr:MAG: hypothetical protein OFPI_11960 [Osedax symbiont Rs2]
MQKKPVTKAVTGSLKSADNVVFQCAVTADSCLGSVGQCG